ncbi:uracil-DNA glycosylase [Geomonas terrae]|uniref:Uracil-DNA glycosylase n=1 Tax=Geomonas terrae TaxID=2562681 RepID=A0A4S1CB66_9BACT|nr:uracil-DNA glycosylase family protein [Geomonas terrae]TGU70547.1 uracil-DNA glycosylase [Geomonas terrae]
MAEMEERDLLLRSLKGYLTGLAESGVDELLFEAAPLEELPAASTGTAAASAAGTVGDMPPATAGGAGSGTATSAPSEAAPAAAAAEPSLRQEGQPGSGLLFLMSGEGFAGAPGGLLAKIIAAMKFKQDEICLVSFEAGQDQDAMARVLAAKVTELAPRVVVSLGEEATSLVLNDQTPLARLRGRFRELQGMAVMPTLHPEALLADEGLKRHVWEDMKLVMRRLGRG